MRELLEEHLPRHALEYFPNLEHFLISVVHADGEQESWTARVGLQPALAWVTGR